MQGHRGMSVLGSAVMPGTAPDINYIEVLSILTCIRVRSEAESGMKAFTYNTHEPCLLIGASRPDSNLFVFFCLISACFSDSFFFLVPRSRFRFIMRCCLRLLWFAYSLGRVL